MAMNEGSPRMQIKNRETVIAASIIAALSLAVMGRHLSAHALFSSVDDDTIYYANWTRQFADSLSQGIWLPRWMPDSQGGYGSPTFVFYSPLVLYLTALLKLISGEFILAAILVKLLALFLSGIFMYVYVKDLWSNNAGLVAAVTYVLLPYRIFDLYVLGVYSSKFAYVWFPLILYYCRRAVNKGYMGADMAMLSLTYALLCLTHLLSAYMLAPVLFGYGLACAGRGRLAGAALKIVLAGFLGLALSAFYLYPILIERPLVHFEKLYTSDMLRYWNHYVFPVFHQKNRFNYPLHDFLVLTVVVSVFSGAAIYLLSWPFKPGKNGNEPVFFIIVVVVTLFLMSSLSEFFWDIVPGLNLLQFPVRWASLMVFSLACLSGAGVYFIEQKDLGFRGLLGNVSGLLLILLVFTVGYCDAQIIGKSGYYTEKEIAGFPKGKDVLEYVPKNVSLGWLSGELKKPTADRVIPVRSDNAFMVEINKWGPEQRLFTVNGGSDTELRIRTFYYPGWQGYVDGKPAALSSEQESGAILLRVPKGGHEVMLTFSDTPDRGWGKILSALAIVFVLYIFVKKIPPKNLIKLHIV